MKKLILAVTFAATVGVGALTASGPAHAAAAAPPFSLAPAIEGLDLTQDARYRCHRVRTCNRWGRCHVRRVCQWVSPRRWRHNRWESRRRWR